MFRLVLLFNIDYDYNIPKTSAEVEKKMLFKIT